MSQQRFRRPFPKDLCAEHQRIWRAWRDNHYNPANPTEWPGGAHIMDSRTSHTERAERWDTKNLEQMIAVEQTCRSGRSRQCTEGHTR